MAVAEVVEAVVPRGRARAALVAMRPRQWTKNLLLFAGILFAAELGDEVRWLEATAAFLAYCAASSAAYLVNDVRDADVDRLHPVKRNRPIARGELPVPAALGLAGCLAALALGVAAALNPWSLALMGAFLAVQAAYTGGVKHVVLVDVLAIAGLFVIRAAAGAEAVQVPISPWLLLCTALLALFLGLAKRRAELVRVNDEATVGRPVLDGYSLPLVDQLVTIVAGSTVIAYALYTFEGRDSRAMMATIPFVLLGVFRYLLLMHRRDLGEEPEEVFLRDAPLAATVAAWALACALILVAT